jgi:hypothetical protein
VHATTGVFQQVLALWMTFVDLFVVVGGGGESSCKKEEVGAN